LNRNNNTMNFIFKDDLAKEQLEELFQSDDKCLEFLAEIKWPDGFICRKCGNANHCPGKTPHSRRCTKCKSEESATSGTMFHNCKFPVSKASCTNSDPELKIIESDLEMVYSH